jgi:hypothetical protein
LTTTARFTEVDVTVEVVPFKLFVTTTEYAAASAAATFAIE